MNIEYRICKAKRCEPDNSVYSNASKFQVLAVTLIIHHPSSHHLSHHVEGEVILQLVSFLSRVWTTSQTLPINNIHDIDILVEEAEFIPH